MPADIRSFFGGGGLSKPAAENGGGAKIGTNPSKPSKRQRGRKVVSDSEEDAVEVKPKSAKMKDLKPKKEIEESKIEETTSSAYFASSGKTKPSRSALSQSKSSEQTSATNGSSVRTPTKVVATNGLPPSTGRRSARKAGAKTYIEPESDDFATILKDEDDDADDIYAQDFKNGSKHAGDDYMEDSDDSVRPKAKAAKTTKKQPAKKEKASIPLKNENIEMADIPNFDGGRDTKRKRDTPSKTSKSATKRKSKDADEGNEEEEDDFLDDDDNDDGPKKKVKKSTAKAVTRKPRTPSKKEEREESKEMQAIFDAIPTVRAPTPPPRDENKKFNYNAYNNSAPPPAEGTKELPIGAENCLAGLTFVFTGVLDSLGREQGQSLVKRYGGKVTTAPSSKTSFVVLGNDAGPKKLETISKLQLKTINEEGLFELIRKLPANGGDSKAAEKFSEKKEKEEKAIRAAAAEMDAQEKKASESRKLSSLQSTKKPAATASQSQGSTVDSRLWTDKYAPQTLSTVCGNKGVVTKLHDWLRKWHDNARFDFKKAGKDGTGIYRAAMLHGPPGIGKTTAAHLVAKLEGFDIVESNASDTRSKKLVENGLRGVLDTTSLLGYFAGDGMKVNASKKKLVLIMDEVDGMSAGDRGGVGALAAVAKKTNIPMILICNERRLPKMKPFDNVTADMAFRRPTADQIRGRISTICFREGIKIPGQVIDALIEGSHADIRQIINMISAAKLDKETMQYDEGKAMSKAWEKHVILKPWDIVNKILRPQMFAPSSTATLNDKIELYFNDHEFSYLMLQENYLKTVPTAASNYTGRERNLKLLEMADNAASSISDGDLVDRMIHGAQQQWSLMPTHAVFSFVRPASYVYGNFNLPVGFVSWLGQNSKYGKLGRFVKEIQGHMRLRASGDRHEIRQQYLPALWQKTVNVLQVEGKEAVPSVIDLMDSYFLTKEDFDAIIELGVGPMSEEKSKIETQTKATFTRLYNSSSHPMPFMKASSVVAPKATRKVQPDLEDAIEESDEGEEVLAENEAKEEEEELDLKKDKYIKAPKKKKGANTDAAGKAGAGKGKKKGKKETAEDDEELDASDNEEEVKKPKKGASKGGRKGKGKA